MQKLKFVNGNGKELDLTSGDYGITNWTGLSESGLNIQTQKVPFQDGSVFLDALIEDRTVSVTVAVNDGWDLEKRYRLKREIISAMNPKLGEGYLVYENDFISKRIDCVPNLPIFPTKNSNDGGTLKATLTFTCNSPYWEDVEDNFENFSLTKRAVIEIDGDVPSDVSLEIVTTGVENPQVRNLTTGQKVALNGNFDRSVHIDTTMGKKSVYDEVENFRMFGATSLNCVAYSEELNRFVIGGYNGVFLTSTDGINFDIIDSITTNPILSIIYSTRLHKFVAVANNLLTNVILTSDDGINWDNSLSTTDFYLNRIIDVESKGLLFGVGKRGSNSILMQSSDGVNWNQTSIISTTDNLYSVTYSEELNLFVAGGDTLLKTSTNGVNWTTVPDMQGIDIYDVTYSEELNLFVAVGYNWGQEITSCVLTSDDGNSWSKTWNAPADVYSKLNSVIWSSTLGMFVAVGEPYILTSADGVNWNTGTNEHKLNAIIFSEGLKLLIGVGSTGIITSTDSVNWTNRTGAITTNLYGMVYASKVKRYVAVGFDGTIIYKDVYDPDWKLAYHNELITRIYDVTYSEEFNLFVAVGNNTVQGFILTSSDGINWTIVKQNLSPYTSVTYSDELNRFVAVCTGGDWYVSDDGINWNITPQSSFIHDDLNSVIWVSQLLVFICVGKNTTFISPDGISWTSSSVTAELNSVAYSNNLHEFVAVGSSGNSGIILTSSDGSTWISHSSDVGILNSIDYSESTGQLCAVGNGGVILTSYDALTWSKRTYGGNLNHVIIQDRTIMMVGTIDFQSYTEDTENQIENLTEDSDMGFHLVPGRNEVMLTYKSGSANAIIRYRNRYIGV